MRPYDYSNVCDICGKARTLKGAHVKCSLARSKRGLLPKKPTKQHVIKTEKPDDDNG